MKASKSLLIPALAVIAVLGFVTFWKKGGTEPAIAPGSQEIRLAYFPNITHAPAIIGIAQGIWRDKLPDANVSVKVVNAGPEAMEALLANELDFSFVGPSPAINAYLKSKGNALRIISGTCLGGASLVRRSDVKIDSIKDLGGKRVAVPQTGGTQDVSCRYYLQKNGLKAKDQGGTVEVISVKNPDILALFKQKQIDAAWVPEPWASRLKLDTGAVTVVDERDLWPNQKFCTTVLVVRKAFADAHPDVVDQVLAAHIATLDWIKSNEADAKKVLNKELKRLSGKEIPDTLLNEAWSKVSFTSDPDYDSILTFAVAAKQAGYLKENDLNLAGILDPRAQRLKGTKD